MTKDKVRVMGYRCDCGRCRGKLSETKHIHGGNLLINYDNPDNTPLVTTSSVAGRLRTLIINLPYTSPQVIRNIKQLAKLYEDAK